MSCGNCNSERVADVSGKCNDLCDVSLGEAYDSHYVPTDMGIGGGDYIRFNYCLDCGHIQGEWPLPTTELEAPDEDEEGDEDELPF